MARFGRLFGWAFGGLLAACGGERERPGFVGDTAVDGGPGGSLGEGDAAASNGPEKKAGEFDPAAVYLVGDLEGISGKRAICDVAGDEPEVGFPTVSDFLLRPPTSKDSGRLIYYVAGGGYFQFVPDDLAKKSDKWVYPKDPAGNDSKIGKCHWYDPKTGAEACGIIHSTDETGSVRAVAADGTVLYDKALVGPDGKMVSPLPKEAGDLRRFRSHAEGGFWAARWSGKTYERWRITSKGKFSLEGKYASPPAAFGVAKSNGTADLALDGAGNLYAMGVVQHSDAVVAKFSKDFKSVSMVIPAKAKSSCETLTGSFVTGP